MKNLILIFFLALLSCKNERIEIDHSKSSNDFSINAIITWGDAPYWIDSVKSFSFQKLDYLSQNQIILNDSISLYDAIHDLKTWSIKIIDKDLKSQNLKIRKIDQIKIDLQNGELLDIKYFKENYENSYNWRNFYKSDFLSNYSIQKDITYDGLIFTSSDSSFVMLHFIDGKIEQVELSYDFNQFK